MLGSGLGSVLKSAVESATLRRVQSSIGGLLPAPSPPPSHRNLVLTERLAASGESEYKEQVADFAERHT